MGSPLKRVCVLGCAGAGKTYVARQLARLAGLPYVDLDRLFWQPGWRVPEEAAWRAVQRGLVAGSEWVLDGNYASTYDERLPLADTVVVLETPRWRCLARVLVRRAGAAASRSRRAAPTSWTPVSWRTGLAPAVPESR